MNIVHRDLKPGNILIDPLTRKIKFCDFGSSKYIESNTVCIHDSISTVSDILSHNSMSDSIESLMSKIPVFQKSKSIF